MVIIGFVDALISQTHNPAGFQTKEDLSGVLDLAHVLQLLRGEAVAVLLSQGQPRLANLGRVSQVSSVLCSCVEL